MTGNSYILAYNKDMLINARKNRRGTERGRMDSGKYLENLFDTCLLSKFPHFPDCYKRETEAFELYVQFLQKYLID